MSESFAVLLVAAHFTAYPAFGDRDIAVPRVANRTAQVQATTDRGPIVEIVLRCGRGSAIVSYSKIERLFCGPRSKCSRSLPDVVTEACR